MISTTLDARREAGQQRAARRRHPSSRAVQRAELAPPPAAFYALAMTVAALVLLGLVMVLSASSITSFHADQSPWRYFSKQLMWAGLGVIALTFTY